MESRKLKFLQEVVGVDGASALTKATSANPDLEWAVIPRVILSWLEVVSHAPDFNGNVPGVPSARLVFKKSESAFSGYIDLGNDTYTFKDASLYHIAGGVAVALGSDHEQALPLHNPALAKLGKSVDLLVRSRTLRKIQGKAGGKGVGPGPGPAAAPIKPLEPIGPEPVQDKSATGGVGTKAAIPVKQAATRQSKNPETPKTKVPGQPKTQPKPPKLPGVKPKTIQVSKAEATNRCVTCDGTQFKGDKFIGCFCFRPLAKSVETVCHGSGYTLKLGSDWDNESILALAESIGK